MYVVEKFKYSQKYVMLVCSMTYYVCPPITPIVSDSSSGLVTSTLTKGNITGVLSEVDISDTIDLESTTVDDTESTTYYDSSITEPEDSLPVEKQPTYLVFESALMLLFQHVIFAKCICCH